MKKIPVSGRNYINETSGMIRNRTDILRVRFDGHVMVTFLRARMNMVFNLLAPEFYI